MTDTNIFKTISDSILFYQLNGFKYINTPWLISETINNITKPVEKQNFYIKNETLVGSGEQSFIQLMANKTITDGNYITCTPCFRDEQTDDIHKTYFIKSELIMIGKECNPNIINDNLHKMINIALTFFQQYLQVKIIKTGEQPNSDEQPNSFDIIETTTETELGSYGIREYKNSDLDYDFKWIYGTACAEPRLSDLINKIKPIGYHDMIIPKQPIGTLGKILEEVDELTDCCLSENKIMGLMELSDLYGAIDMYLQYNLPTITMDDLAKMNQITKRVFQNGVRN